MASTISPEVMLNIIESLNDGVVVVDARLPDLPIIYANKGFEKLTGYSRGEILNKNCRFLQNGDDDQADLTVLRQAVESKKPCRVELENYRKNGDKFWNELSLSPIFDDQKKLIYFVGVQKDITDRKRYEATQVDKTHTDVLTKVHNHHGFEAYWNRINNLRTEKKQYVGVALVNVIGFRQINELQGHFAGDKVLCALSENLAVIHRTPDLVARLGGDEFAILLLNDKPIDVEKYEARLVKELDKLMGQSRLPCAVFLRAGCAAQSEDKSKSLQELFKEAGKRMLLDNSGKRAL